MGYSQCHLNQVNRGLPSQPRDSNNSWVRMSALTAALREKNRSMYANTRSACFASLPIPLEKLESVLKKKRRGTSTPTNIPA
jgi:hypothetical protein